MTIHTLTWRNPGTKIGLAFCAASTCLVIAAAVKLVNWMWGIGA
ncbi:hypothetical protein [Henriciella aquimarina]|nr:hypothetical protein [Henriciella aquimarina]